MPKTPHTAEIMAETEVVLKKFHAYVGELRSEGDVEGLTALACALAGNLSAYTIEVIRQRLQDGFRSEELLPKYAIEHKRK